MPLLSYSVGDRVRHKGCPATVKFVGMTLWCDDAAEWVGLELDRPLGKHDGEVNGTRYFNAKPEHGIIVRRIQLQPIGVISLDRTAQEPSPKVPPAVGGAPAPAPCRLDFRRPGGAGSAITSPASPGISVRKAEEYERRRERSEGSSGLNATLQAAQEALDASASRRRELRRAASFGRSPSSHGSAPQRRAGHAPRVLTPGSSSPPPRCCYHAAGSPATAHHRRRAEQRAAERQSKTPPHAQEHGHAHADTPPTARPATAAASAPAGGGEGERGGANRTAPKEARGAEERHSAGGCKNGSAIPHRNGGSASSCAACEHAQPAAEPHAESPRDGAGAEAADWREVARWSHREVVRQIVRGQWPPAELID